jgi:hypothetical protein
MKESFTARLSMLALIALIVFSGLVFTPASAQERTGELSGTVTDASKAVVPGATVSVTNRASNRVLTVKTGGDGTWIAPQLEPGRY